MNTLNGHHLDVLFRADEVLLDCTEPGGVDLDAAGSVLLTPAPEPPSLAYRLVSDELMGCARVEWEDGPADMTAAALLQGPHDEEERTERDTAAAWLTDYLTDAGGSAPAKDVARAARADGIAERTLKRARTRAGIESERRGFGQGSVWTLNPSGPHSGRSGQHKTAGTNGPNVAPMATVTPLRTPTACTICGQPLHPAVTADGFTTCPTCEPEADR